MCKLKAVIFFLLLISFKNSYGQAIYTRIIKIGKIVFSNGVDNSSLPAKEKAARLCNSYMLEYYKKRRLPLIYLSFTLVSTSEEALYQLSYDNLYGTSLQDNNTKGKRKFNKPGIRIRSRDTTINEIFLLKLLDYSINHLPELKSLSQRAIKQSEESNSSLQLASDKIERILSAPVTNKIRHIVACYEQKEAL
jgi:hypothetical protein